MNKRSRRNMLVTVVAAVALMAAGGITGSRGDHRDDQGVLYGRIVAIGIPGVSAISPVGTFLAGGPIHDKPALAALNAVNPAVGFSAPKYEVPGRATNS